MSGQVDGVQSPGTAAGGGFPAVQLRQQVVQIGGDKVGNVQFHGFGGGVGSGLPYGGFQWVGIAAALRGDTPHQGGQVVGNFVSQGFL